MCKHDSQKRPGPERERPRTGPSGFLLERGITIAKGPANLRNQMPAILEDADQNLTPRMRNLLRRVWQEWRQLECDIATASDEIERIAGEDEACKRLRQIPGVGPLVSTATVAAIGNGAAFRQGREFAAWLGLVPRQTQPAARSGCSASASVATSICAACSSMVPGPCCYG